MMRILELKKNRAPVTFSARGYMDHLLSGFGFLGALPFSRGSRFDIFRSHAVAPMRLFLFTPFFIRDTSNCYNTTVLIPDICVVPNVVRSESLKTVYARNVGKRVMKFTLTKVLILAILLTLAVLAPYSVISSKTEEAQVPTTQEQVAVEEPYIPPAERTRAIAIASTIAELETRGTLDCSKVGLSGERGCHQFMPSTWRAYSTEVFGRVVEQTPANAQHVTEEMVYGWIMEGYTDRDIFLTWNQGHRGKCRAGVNKHGVEYDSCAYVADGLAMLSKVVPK